ncbi:MAG: asparagine synthase (glutamine-hydrolysing) [Planctomycetota bacterium]|nr:MAG: asparagine synthase (glutamine-hydrolysing) [Planctomycetota bacterium]
MHHAYVERVVDLLDPAGNVLLNMSVDEATARVASGDPTRIREIDGQFALWSKNGPIVRLARSIGRPMRYFLAKRAEGPCLIIAERIDEIAAWLKQEGFGDQFHPSYSRMVPAHHLTEIALLGCPDPSPTLTRFFAPQRNRLSTNLDEIGAAYIGTLAAECDKWLDRIDRREPLGVLFSGGIDSGALFLVLHHLLLRRGESPARLKAFTLRVGSDANAPTPHSPLPTPHSSDVAQAARFLDELDLGLFLEVIDVPSSELDIAETIRVIEDYKPLDVQSATMALALCRAIRRRYPDWNYLTDGDGGDENLKDYPIEDNPELTIRSVLNNTMLYQEGWGVDAIKHSLTYSGGQSRGHIRTAAPARACGFVGFSPYALPNVIEVAEGIPFIELTDWDHTRLYALKGEIVRRGVEAVTGLTMPVFEKRRFQHGAVDNSGFEQLFAHSEADYRRMLTAAFAST